MLMRSLVRFKLNKFVLELKEQTWNTLQLYNTTTLQHYISTSLHLYNSILLVQYFCFEGILEYYIYYYVM